MSYHTFHESSLAHHRPRGWIKRWLEIQRHGLTGNLEVAGYPFDTGLWACPAIPYRRGAPWWPYEQTAYWVDGFTRAGCLLDDRELTRKSQKQIEYVLKHAGKDGYLGPRSCKEPMPAGRWSHMIFFRAMIAHYSATGDKRIVKALHRHYIGSPFDHSGHRDVCNVEIMCWVYGQTGDRRLLDMAEHTWRNYQARAEDDDVALTGGELRADRPAECHGVTFCETVKQGAILYLYTGKRRYLNQTLAGFRKLDNHHMLLSGAPSSTETLRGFTALDAHETCDIADYTWSAGYLLLATGKAEFADKIERAVFNAHPGAVTKDFRALQYFSGANQVVLGRNSAYTKAAAGGKWMCYRPRPGTECCTGEVNRIMPNYVARMWMTKGNDPVAALYGPSTHRIGITGTPVTITEETSYPFGEHIDFCIDTDKPARFTLWLRIPAWCTGAELYKNDIRVKRTLKPGSFVPLQDTFKRNDRVRLVLPMRLKLRRWPDGGVSIERGPLVFALPIAERRERDRKDKNQSREFPAWNMYPTGKWNYALCVNEKNLESVVDVHYGPPTLDPWSHPPVSLRVPVREVKGWRIRKAKRLRAQAGELVDPARNKWRLYEKTIYGDFMLTPPLPDPATLKSRLGGKVQQVTLVPYGCTLLRVGIFPDANVGKGRALRTG